MNNLDRCVFAFLSMVAVSAAQKYLLAPMIKVPNEIWLHWLSASYILLTVATVSALVAALVDHWRLYVIATILFCVLILLPSHDRDTFYFVTETVLGAAVVVAALRIAARMAQFVFRVGLPEEGYIE